LLGAQIVAQDYLDIDTVSQPGRRLKFRPGEKFLIQDCGHPFRLRPVVDNCSVNPEITKIIDSHHPLSFQMEPRPGGVGQVVNPVAVEDGDMSLHLMPPGLVTAKYGGFAHLDGGGSHYHHKNGGKNKQEEGKQDLYRQFGGPFFSLLGPLDPEKRSVGAESLDDTGAHSI